MGNLVKIELDVTPEAAAALENEENRRAIGRIVSRIVETRSYGIDPLMETIRQIKERAHAAGLTDEEVDAELAAYNAERRS